VAGAGVAAAEVTRHFSAMMRYVGQGYEIETPVTADMVAGGDRQALLAAFTAAYDRRYGRSEKMPVEVLSWRLVVSGPDSPLAQALARKPAAAAAAAPEADGRRPVWFGRGFVKTPVYQRRRLAAGVRLAGPAIVEEVESTVVVPPDFALAVDAAANLILTAPP
jgi:N-methylhydantoinase A